MTWKTLPSLPGLGQLSRLTRLNLSEAGFSGKIPFEVSFLNQLVSLDLSLNELNLEEPVPQAIVQNLNQDKENSNLFFEWKLPDSIGNLMSLIKLLLYDCKFYGPIPISLGNLTEITWLELSCNNFTGTSLTWELECARTARPLSKQAHWEHPSSPHQFEVYWSPRRLGPFTQPAEGANTKRPPI
ncbi:receptor-like protein 35 [Diospyros lotus]|uniref:receptor-like protein 35 n=1 Tax=Diospyros lotus TaxID=55363 RepID=UPI00225AC670|nr:receptor-like protein 35 [Diospyros lotus]